MNKSTPALHTRERCTWPSCCLFLWLPAKTIASPFWGNNFFQEGSVRDPEPLAYRTGRWLRLFGLFVFFLRPKRHRFRFTITAVNKKKQKQP